MIRVVPEIYIPHEKPPNVPIYPSCSQYGLEAIQKYGALKGGASGGLEDPAVQSFFKGRI